MTLCVCGHDSREHAQFDSGEYCMACHCREYRPIHKEAVDSEESTAPLSAGVTPEGLAEETVAEPVNEAARDLRTAIVERHRDVGNILETLDAALATERRHTVVLMENEGVVTWGDDRHRARFLDEVAS